MQTKVCMHVDLAPNMHSYRAFYSHLYQLHKIITISNCKNIKTNTRHRTFTYRLTLSSINHQPTFHTQTYPTRHPFTHPPIHPYTTTHPHIQIQCINSQKLFLPNTQQNLPAWPYQNHNIVIYIYMYIYIYL